MVGFHWTHCYICSLMKHCHYVCWVGFSIVGWFWLVHLPHRWFMYLGFFSACPMQAFALGLNEQMSSLYMLGKYRHLQNILCTNSHWNYFSSYAMTAICIWLYLDKHSLRIPLFKPKFSVLPLLGTFLGHSRSLSPPNALSIMSNN